MNEFIQYFNFYRLKDIFLSIAITTGLLFIFQELATCFLLKATANMAGFELFSNLTELFFFTVLLLTLMYYALHPDIIFGESPVHAERIPLGKFLMLSKAGLSYLIIVGIVSSTFFISDLVRYLFCMFYETRDDFSQLLSPHVFLMQNVRDYILGGSYYIRMNVIGGFMMICSLLSLCGYLFRRIILIKLFLLLLILLTAVLYIDIHCFVQRLIKNSNLVYEFILYYLAFIIELSVTSMSVCIFLILHKQYKN